MLIADPLARVLAEDDVCAVWIPAEDKSELLDRNERADVIRNARSAPARELWPNRSPLSLTMIVSCSSMSA
jgi:hypothetical protein